MVSLNIETKGFDDLARQARDPRITKQGLGRILPRARRASAKAMKESIEGGSGLAVRSLFARYSVAKLEMVAGTLMKSARRALSIEHGRNPGTWIPFRIAQRWLRDVGMPADGASVSEFKQQVNERGTQGKGYLAATQNVIRENLPKWTRDALKSITRSLVKKGIIPSVPPNG